MKNRKLNRLNSYDYLQQGMYFITICIKNREEFFGEIKNTEMVLNDVGKIILKNLNNVSNYSPSVFLDENIIMPNHVHLIIEIIGNVGADLVSAQNKKIQIKNSGQTQGLSLQNSNQIGLLSKIIQAFKSKSAVEYIFNQ